MGGAMKRLSEGIVEAAAHFTSLPQLEGGLCRINIAGPAGSLARVEFSEDLQQWAVAGDVTLNGGVGQFQEIVDPGNSSRFYRLKNF